MTHLIMVRGPSCVGRSTLVRALAHDPSLDIEHVLSDRMAYYSHGKWGVSFDFGKLINLAKALLDEPKRDLVVEECFRDSLGRDPQLAPPEGLQTRLFHA